MCAVQQKAQSPHDTAVAVLGTKLVIGPFFVEKVLLNKLAEFKVTV